MSTQATVVSNGTSLKKELLQLAKRYATLPVDGDESARRAKDLAALVAALSSDTFRLVVMGEIKKGKSSLINALLSYPNLMPTDTDVATSTVYKIVYGAAEKYTVFFLPGDDDAPEPKPLPITRTQLKDFGTEKGNPENEKRVDFIAVELPHPLLKSGLTIVDTPGVGGLFKAHRDITFKYAPNADVVFFVLDSNYKPISEAEISFLKELKKNTRQIVFVQTMIDLAGEEQVQAYRDRNLDELSKEIGIARGDIPYFLVSAKLRELADQEHNDEYLTDSGYPAVLEYLETAIIPNRDRIVAQKWVPYLQAEVGKAGRLLADRLAMAQETSRKELESYEAKVLKAEQEFDAWENGVGKERAIEFRKETDRLKRNAKRSLEDVFQLDNSILREMMRHATATCSTADEVFEKSEEIRNDHAARCNAVAEAIIADFKKSYLEVYDRTIGADVADLQAIEVPEMELKMGIFRPSEATTIGAMREAYMTGNTITHYAGMVLKTTASIAGWLVMFGHPIGWTIGAGTGVAWLATRIWGEFQGYSMARERQLNAALHSLQQALMGTSSVAGKASMRRLEDLIVELDQGARDGFEALRTQIRAEFTTLKDELRAMKTRTENERNKVIAELREQLQVHAGLFKRVEEITAQLNAEAA